MNFHITLIFLIVCFRNICGTTILSNGTKIVDTNGKVGDQFGRSVAMNNNYFVVGSPYDDENGISDSGSTFVYTVNGNELQENLVPSDGQTNKCGYSVRINLNNYIVIGCLGHKSSRGCAYIYHLQGNQWTNQKIVADERAEYNYFGRSVDINDNNEVVVGAIGSAYIFTHSNNTWTQIQKLVPKDLSADDYFGYSVSITDLYLAIGAPHQDDQSGSAYIYRKNNNNNNWEQQTKVTSPNKQGWAYFGNAINVHDKRVVIGAMYEDYDKGRVYVYVTDGVTWKLEGTLQASDAKKYDYFGISVDMNNNNIVIGADTSENSAYDFGCVYIYQLSNGTWNEIFKLIPADGQAHDYFGSSVTIFNNTVVVGSYSNDAKGSNSGAAYIFNLGFKTELRPDSNLKITPASTTDSKIYSTIKTTPASTNDGGAGSPANVIDSGAVFVNFTILCDEEYMMGIWNRKQFTGKGNLTISLIDPTCNQFHQNNTHLWIVTNFTNCGTVTIETNSTITKQNTAKVTLTNFIANVVKRQSFEKYIIMCQFNRRKNITSSNSFNSTDRNIGTVNQLLDFRFTDFSVHVALYTNKLFSEIASSPFTVTSFQPIYIGITESRQNKLFKFIVQQCFATPSSDINGPKYTFFYNKCRMDPSFVTIDNNTDHFKFKIDAFTFIQVWQSIHIHCQLYICTSNATSADCQQSCIKRKRRAISLETPLKEVTVTTSKINFEKKMTCNELQCPLHSSCINIYPAVCRCNNDNVFNPTTTACETKNIFHINGLHLDTEFVSPYLDSRSTIFINFARKIEKQLNYCITQLREGTIEGVQVIRARKGSVIIDLAVVYAKHSNKEDAYETFVKSIKYNYTKTLHYPNEIKIKSDITPTMPTALGNRTLIIALIVTLVTVAIALVVIIMIKKINCKRSQKKEKQSREQTTMALLWIK